MATSHNMLTYAEAWYQHAAALQERGCTDFAHRDSVVELGIRREATARMFEDAISAFTPDINRNTPKIIIHCVRHAQGPHNLHLPKEETCSMKDPGVTDFGVLQCATLCKTFPRMDKITHIISSPSRRTILTTKLSFRPLLNRGVPIVLLSFLKEKGRCAVNEGTPVEELRREFNDLNINYEHLHDGWETSFLDYATYGWRSVAIEMRREVFMVGMEALRKGEVNADGNVEMVVTSHGRTLRFFDGAKDKYDGYHWHNTGHRAYEFFSEERAQKRGVLRWQGLRQCLAKDFNTSDLEHPLQVKNLEDWGWSVAERERINVYRDGSLLSFQKLRADRRRLKE